MYRSTTRCLFLSLSPTPLGKCYPLDCVIHWIDYSLFYQHRSIQFEQLGPCFISQFWRWFEPTTFSVSIQLHVNCNTFYFEYVIVMPAETSVWKLREVFDGKYTVLLAFTFFCIVMGSWYSKSQAKGYWPPTVTMRWGIFQRHFLPGDYDGLTSKQYCLIRCSLHSKRLEVVGTRMRAREGDK